MQENISKAAMGWLPDRPDLRDCTISNVTIPGNQKKPRSIQIVSKKKLPKKVDLTEFCSPIENQGNLGSCTAHAGVALYEYYQRRAFGDHIDCSRLFLYKVSRNLMKTIGDSGAYLRTTMGAMVLFGIPPEKYWEYDERKFDEEPPAFCYSFANNYQAIRYFRFDPVGINKQQVLESIKNHLHAGIPSMFGFTVYNSIEQALKNGGKIPFPLVTDGVFGGHAMCAVGYDDDLVIINQGKHKQQYQTKGALLIRNSWGTSWGDEGYGWLPYEYVLRGLAIDWWSLMNLEWIETGQFDINLK